MTTPAMTIVKTMPTMTPAKTIVRAMAPVTMTPNSHNTTTIKMIMATVVTAAGAL